MSHFPGKEEKPKLQKVPSSDQFALPQESEPVLDNPTSSDFPQWNEESKPLMLPISVKVEEPDGFVLDKTNVYGMPTTSYEVECKPMVQKASSSTFFPMPVETKPMIPATSSNPAEHLVETKPMVHWDQTIFDSVGVKVKIEDPESFADYGQANLDQYHADQQGPNMDEEEYSEFSDGSEEQEPVGEATSANSGQWDVEQQHYVEMEQKPFAYLHAGIKQEPLVDPTSARSAQQHAIDYEVISAQYNLNQPEMEMEDEEQSEFSEGSDVSETSDGSEFSEASEDSEEQEPYPKKILHQPIDYQANLDQYNADQPELEMEDEEQSELSEFSDGSEEQEPVGEATSANSGQWDFEQQNFVEMEQKPLAYLHAGIKQEPLDESSSSNPAQHLVETKLMVHKEEKPFAYLHVGIKQEPLDGATSSSSAQQQVEPKPMVYMEHKPFVQNMVSSNMLQVYKECKPFLAKPVAAGSKKPKRFIDPAIYIPGETKEAFEERKKSWSLRMRRTGAFIPKESEQRECEPYGEPIEKKARE